MKFFKHLGVVTRHRNMVFKHCCKCGIFWQGLVHDLSKFSPKEFIPGVKYFQGNRSPQEQEREELGYSESWMHHKGRNKHHHEYWTDFNKQIKEYAPVKMPLKYVKEMFCDRLAASKIYNGKKYQPVDMLNYYMNNNTRNRIHKETADLLELWMNMLIEKGEKETFKTIKNTKSY